MKKSNLAITEGWLSICGNIILFILKYLAGLATGSVAIIADAWHTLSDSLTSIVVIIGAKYVAKPADEKHPFGHGRAELIASVIIGAMLGIAGFNFIIDGIEKFLHQEQVTYNLFAIIIVALSVLTKELMAQFSFWAYRKTGSNSLKADGWHHRSDAITSALLLVGIFLGRFLPWLDALLGIAISVLIMVTAVMIIREGINKLLGEQPDAELLDRIRQIIHSVYPARSNSHHFHLHSYGLHQELTFHMEFNGSMSIEEGHRIITVIEKKILEQLHIETTIHLEPLEVGNQALQQ